MGMLALHGFNFPLCRFGPVHLTYLVICFPWDEVPILEIEYLFPQEADLGANIVMKVCVRSAPMPTIPAISKSFVSLLALSFYHL